MAFDLKRHIAPVAVAAALGLAAAGSAEAENVHERGTVTSLDGSVLKIKDNAGKDVTLDLDDGWKIVGA